MVLLTLNSIPLRAILRCCRISFSSRTLSDEEEVARTDLPEVGPGDGAHRAVVDRVRVQARTEVLLALGLRILISIQTVQTHGKNIP